MNRRSYIRNVDEEKNRARQIRETFMDRPATKVSLLKWKWPTTMVEAGQCLAVMYSSDKWQPPGDYQDYKHVAEDEQLVFMRSGFLVDGDGNELDLAGPEVEVDGPLPETIAVLAPIIGLQVRLYDGENGEHYLPNGKNAYQINLAKAMLGAAVHPSTGEEFLIVYSPTEVLAIITGKSLSVMHDGIVG